jgi:hypothetical protein
VRKKGTDLLKSVQANCFVESELEAAKGVKGDAGDRHGVDKKLHPLTLIHLCIGRGDSQKVSTGEFSQA